MIYDSMTRLILYLCASHGFIELWANSARLDVSNDIQLFMTHGLTVPNKTNFYITRGTEYRGFPVDQISFDEFFDELPPECKEVFSWNLHLLE
jgi:hypothetical protein